MRTCKNCKHSLLRFNGGNGATTCNLLFGRIVLYGHNQDRSPKECPYNPFPQPTEDVYSFLSKPMKINAKNFHEVVEEGKIYCSHVVMKDKNSYNGTGENQTLWKFSKVVTVEDDMVIFEVKTVEEFSRRIVMASHGEGWHREITEPAQRQNTKYVDPDE